MLRFFIPCFSSIGIIFPGFGLTQISAQYAHITRVSESVFELSKDDYLGRVVGSESEKKAAIYIRNQFKKLKLDTILPTGYLHPFESTFFYKSSSDSTIEIPLKSQNVIGFLNNRASTTILIGAHYDHIGRNEFNLSKDVSGKSEIHNGADDNASGVAAVIEIAQVLSNNGITEKSNYIFACFSGEEIGLIGSKEASSLLIDSLKWSIDAMINLDMIGRMDSLNRLYVGGVGTSAHFKSILENNKPAHFQLILDSSGIGPSDHSSFYLKSVPVLFFFTGTHADYHKPTDDFEKINLISLVEIINYLNSIIREISCVESLDFLKTRQLETTKRAKTTVALGIIPSYQNNSNGLQIDGVVSGKTAHKIGIQQGDILIQMNDCVVTDIYTYMNCLSAFKKEDAVIITILRNQKKVSFNTRF